MSIRSKSILGVKWTSFSTICITVVGILRISVLARILDSSDFGLMALVVFILGILELFMDMGLTSAILHKQSISKKEYASLYWINFIFSIILFSVLLLLSSSISIFYDEPELGKIIPIMAWSIIFSALGRQFKSIEQKNLNFKFIALADVFASILGLILAIFFAFEGKGVYALVYGTLFQSAVANFIYLAKGITDKGLLFHFNSSEARPFLKIGIFEVGSQLVNYFNRDLDILLVGKLFGSDILGSYSLAKQLAKRPMQVLNPIMSRVASPVLALYQENQKELRLKYLEFLNIVSTLNFIVYGALVLFAKPLIWLFYGEEFMHIVTIVQILGGYMFLRAVTNTAGSLIIATGKTNVGFYWNLFLLCLFPLVIYLSASFSITVMTVSILVLMLVLLVPYWKFVINKLLNVGLSEFLSNILPSFRRLLILAQSKAL